MVVCSAIVCGCGKDSGQSDSVKPGKELRAGKKANLPLIDRLDATGVLIRVGCRAITKGDLVSYENLRCKAWAAAKGIKWSLENEEAKRFYANMRMRNIGDLVRNAMIEQYAEEKGIQADAAKIEKAKKKFLSGIRKPRGDFDKIVATLGENEAVMAKKGIEMEALTLTVLSKFSSNDLERVSAQDISNRIEFVQRWNDLADKKNAAQRQKALQAKAEILKTNNFALVAKKYADFCPEQGSEWETYNLDDLEPDDPLLKWLLTAEVGDISDPLDLEDGFSIVGLKHKSVSAITEDPQKPIYDYVLVRCPFYAYEKQEVIEDRKALVEDILEKRRNVAMLELRELLTKKYDIVFPNGRNFFYREHKRKKKGAKK